MASGKQAQPVVDPQDEHQQEHEQERRSQQVPQRPVNPNDPKVVNPHGDNAEVTPGTSTMSGLFGQAEVVDEVQEIPIRPQAEQYKWWVIRTNAEVEDMTVGDPDFHFSFKAGVRYKVPERVARILYSRDMLMEQPYQLQE